MPFKFNVLRDVRDNGDQAKLRAVADLEIVAAALGIVGRPANLDRAVEAFLNEIQGANHQATLASPRSTSTGTCPPVAFSMAWAISIDGRRL